MIRDVHAIMAISPQTSEIERAWLFENHFGRGHHAIRFESDGANAAYYSERKIPWQTGHDLPANTEATSNDQ